MDRSSCLNNTDTRDIAAPAPAGQWTQNAFAASFNGRLKDECLIETPFGNLAEARQTIETWGIDLYEDDSVNRGMGFTCPHRVLAIKLAEEW